MKKIILSALLASTVAATAFAAHHNPVPPPPPPFGVMIGQIVTAVAGDGVLISHLGVDNIEDGLFAIGAESVTLDRSDSPGNSADSDNKVRVFKVVASPTERPVFCAQGSDGTKKLFSALPSGNSGAKDITIICGPNPLVVTNFVNSLS